MVCIPKQIGKKKLVQPVARYIGKFDIISKQQPQQKITLVVISTILLFHETKKMVKCVCVARNN